MNKFFFFFWELKSLILSPDFSHLSTAPWLDHVFCDKTNGITNSLWEKWKGSVDEVGGMQSTSHISFFLNIASSKYSSEILTLTLQQDGNNIHSIPAAC